MIHIEIASLDGADRYWLGHQLNDTILECSFNSYNCYDDLWLEFFSPYYGNCFTYNFLSSSAAQEDSEIIKRAGPRNGKADHLGSQLCIEFESTEPVFDAYQV